MVPFYNGHNMASLMEEGGGKEGGMETQMELDAAAAAEIEMNYMTMSKLKDDRIKRLEEMLADAHECLEKLEQE